MVPTQRTVRHGKSHFSPFQALSCLRALSPMKSVSDARAQARDWLAAMAQLRRVETAKVVVWAGSKPCRRRCPLPSGRCATPFGGCRGSSMSAPVGTIKWPRCCSPRRQFSLVSRQREECLVRMNFIFSSSNAHTHHRARPHLASV